MVARSSGPDAARGVPELAAGSPLRDHPGVAALGELVEGEDGRGRQIRPRLHDDHRLDPRQLVADFLNLLELQSRRDDRDPRAAVLQDVARLRRRERRIDRHGHAAAGQHGEVGNHPLGPALGHQRHAVAARHPEPAEAERDVPDALEHLLAGQAVDLSAAASPEHARLLKPAHHMERQIGDRADVAFGLSRGKGGGHGRDYTTSWRIGDR